MIKLNHYTNALFPMAQKLKKHPILGVHVSATDLTLTTQFVDESIKGNRLIYVCVAAVHLVMECQHIRGLLDGVNRADLVAPDGMPLVWLLKAVGHAKVNRVYGPDLMLALCRLAAERNYSVFLLGGARGQSKQLARVLVNKFHGLKIAGIHDAPIRPTPDKDNSRVIKQIIITQPDIVFVGMGCPYQELWMIENREKLKAPVLIGVGAAFDFLSGRVRQAPPWMQNIGLEWLFRFMQEPKRLWRRYTITNVKFLYLLLRSWLFVGYGK